MTSPHRTFLAQHRVISYFLLTYAISWAAAFAVVAPKLLRHQPIPLLDGILMFPAMLVGPCVAGILMTRFVDGKSGVRQLFARMRRIQFGGRWYLTLLIPPVAILVVLAVLARTVSPDFTHGLYLVGATYGIAAAFFEEIGWTGFALPKMSRAGNTVGPAILLGVLWGCWHIPVISYLGTTAPHHHFWLQYFLAFVAVMTAIRVIIAWVYANTSSVVSAQLLHFSSTGSLVVLSAPRVSAGQEVLWYALYAIALWIIVAIVAAVFGKTLAGRSG